MADVPMFTPTIRVTIEKLLLVIITIVFFYVYVFENPSCNHVILNDIKYQSILVVIICFFDFFIMRLELKPESMGITVGMLLLPFITFMLNIFLIGFIQTNNKEENQDKEIITRVQPIFLASQISYCIYIVVFSYKYYKIEMLEMKSKE